MKSTFVHFNDVRLHVVDAGEEHDECMIFLHGFPESHLSWTPYVTAFSKSHHVVAPDNRGFGESDKPLEISAYDIQEIVADIVGLANHFSTKPITLVGHDWGGVAAWHVAAEHPQLLKRMVILNAPHPTIFSHSLISNDAQRAASQYINRFRDGGCEARLQAIGLEAFWMSVFGAHFASGAITEAHKAKQIASWREPGALTAMLNWYRASAYEVSPASEALAEGVAPLANIVVPTLVIWGIEDSVLLPCQIEGLSDYVESLTVKTLVNAGHGLIHDSPHEIIELIRKFIVATD